MEKKGARGHDSDAQERRRVEHERDLERIGLLRPIDDDFMRCLFKDDIELTQVVLRILTGMGDLKIVRSETQRDLRRLAGARSFELDVWGVDSKGGWHDIEVQRGNAPDPRRARYHSAAMDIEALDAGMPFTRLPEQWVIFLMEQDPYERGDGTYIFERSCVRDGGRLGDGTHVLYANGAYRADDELGRLMGDFCQSDPGRMQTEVLRKRVEYFKNEPKGVAQMCEILEQMRDDARREGLEQGLERGLEQGLEQGLERGKEQGLLESVRNMTRKLGMSAQSALEVLEVPKAEWARYLSML